jgi:hypothetical protein
MTGIIFDHLGSCVCRIFQDCSNAFEGAKGDRKPVDAGLVVAVDSGSNQNIAVYSFTRQIPRNARDRRATPDHSHKLREKSKKNTGEPLYPSTRSSRIL